MIDSKALTWHAKFAQDWLDRIEQGRLPHAVLLAGPAGVGKRSAASWMAARHLLVNNAAQLPQYPMQRVAHADMRWISPLQDKQTIGIDQIRELVAEMSLTSYKGGGKVAVIEPAESMTNNAANSLLKTLEEPNGDALLILVADRKGRLPATLFSRCQKIDFAVPTEREALQWLDQVQPGNSWAEALSLAGNAPLGAIAAVEQLGAHAAMSRDFAAVASGTDSALDVAVRWTKLDIGFVLEWLARQVQAAIFRASNAGKGGAQAAISAFSSASSASKSTSSG